MPRILLLLILAVYSEVSHGVCVNKQTNVVTFADVGSYPISFGSSVWTTYDANNNPSCYKNSADLKAPGSIRATSGALTVAKQFNLYGKTKALLTLSKDSWFVGTMCKDGVSQNPLVPHSDCQVPLCESQNGDDKSLCHALSTVGEHTLGELEGASGINGTIPLPGLPAAFRPLIEGRWKMEVKLQVDSEIVAHIKLPANEEWLYAME